MAESTEKLIECVRKHICLYDTNNNLYKNVTLKAKLWEEIGIEINETSEIAKKKWKNLRDNYLRYKKESAGTTGQAAKKYRKWPWISQLKFLDKSLTERERTSNISTNSNYSATLAETPPETDTQETYTEMSPPTIPTSMSSLPSTAPQTSGQASTSIHSHRQTSTSTTQKQKKKDDDLDKVINFIQNKKRPEYDAIDNLFKSYAQTFKTFSLQNQIMIKIELAKLFGNVELKEAQERAQEITYSPVYSIVSDNSDSQNNISQTFKENNSQIVIDLSTVNTALLTSNGTTHQQQQDLNMNVVNLGATTSTHYDNALDMYQDVCVTKK